jgi:hypothetical protein
MHGTGRPGIAWPFFVRLIALSLLGRFAAPLSLMGYYHEEKAT